MGVVEGSVVEDGDLLGDRVAADFLGGALVGAEAGGGADPLAGLVLGPERGIQRHLRGPTRIVEGPVVLVEAQDPEEQQQEEQEAQHRRDVRHRTDQSVDLPLQLGHLFDGDEHLEDTQEPHRLQVHSPLAHHKDRADEDGEVEGVPAISQVGPVVEDEAQPNDLYQCLKNENHRENVINSLQDLVALGEVFAIFEVFAGQEDGVGKD
mmetsp:Transcript_10534/g.10605  ORF Transcript_10534/g.10605 Transcript_10534/m.10605 type:complete len:208 (+) Transcript_10534:1054-1677(+)